MKLPETSESNEHIKEKESEEMIVFKKNHMGSDGSIPTVIHAIKKILSDPFNKIKTETPKWIDPKSLEHVQTTYTYKSDFLNVKTIFRCIDEKGKIETYEAETKVILNGYVIGGVTKPLAKNVIIKNSKNQILLGELNSRSRNINKMILSISLIIVTLLVLFVIGIHHSSSTPRTPEETRNAQLENIFSKWDGSLPALTTLIKKSMNDPSSYEHVKTVYWDKGSHLVVKTTFRGKNAFGGIVSNSVTAKVNKSGSVIDIISQ